MSFQPEEDQHPIRSLCYGNARNLYGDSMHEKVVFRLEEELEHIIRNGFAEPYLVAARIVHKAYADGYLTAIRGSVGSSFVAFLLGITEINPLPPHYRCHICRRIEWVADCEGNGFDLPDKLCPECGGDCKGDGHKIPYEMFLGVNGDIPPKIQLYVAGEFEESAKKELKAHMDNRESGSSVLLPEVFAHDELSILKRLHILTGVSPAKIPMNDPDVLSLFRSTAALGVTPEHIGSGVATYGIPEMGVHSVREILELTQPSSFHDLVQIVGLSHGNGTWVGNAMERIQAGTGTLATSIASRDQLMMELIGLGMEVEAAYAIADSKWKGVSVSEREAMLKCNIPDWYIESCLKIKYAFPKSHSVSYAMMAVRFAFYKLYYPVEFYAAYFTVRGGGLDMELCAQGSEAILSSLKETPNEIVRPLMEVALEMTARGFRIKKSSEGEGYVIEGEKHSIEVPLK